MPGLFCTSSWLNYRMSLFAANPTDYRPCLADVRLWHMTDIDAGAQHVRC